MGIVFKKKAYSELFVNYILNLINLRIRARRFRPLITNYYVTKRCNLKCRYCDPVEEEPELDTASALALLEKIRPHNPVLNFTGGEPLLYKDISSLLQKAKKLCFYPIILSTNALLIDRIVDEIHLVDHLIISLDSLDEKINDSLCGREGVTSKIIKKIKECADLAGEKKFHMSLHAVIAPETIVGIEDLVSFCRSLGITLSLSPEHGRFLPHPGLKENMKYTDLIERLITLKDGGSPIACSSGFLKTIRNFSPHRCYPFLTPRVEPDGRVYFPCQRIKKRYVYLQEHDSLYKLMQREIRVNFFQECSERCFLACYVDVENYLKNPLSLLDELPVRNWVFGKRVI